MVTLRRVSLISAGRVGFWFSVATNLTFIIISVLFMIIANVPITSLGIDFLVRMAVILTLNGLISSFTAGATAYIYNIIANKFGGLQFEFDVVDSAAGGKRKNDERFVSVEIETDGDSESE